MALVIASGLFVTGVLLILPLILALVIAYFLAWPIMKYLKTTPVLARCPKCKDRFKPGPQVPVPGGLRINTRCCDTLMLIPGEWSGEGDEASFRPDPDFRITILDDQSAPVKTVTPINPKFYAIRWVDHSPS